MPSRSETIDLLARRVRDEVVGKSPRYALLRQALNLDLTRTQAALTADPRDESSERSSHLDELLFEDLLSGISERREDPLFVDQLRSFAESRAHGDLESMVTRFNPNLFAWTVFWAGFNYMHILNRVQVVEETPGTLRQIRRLAKSEPLFTASGHQSNIDQVLLGTLFYKHRIPMPLFQAGANLGQGKTKHLLPLLGAYFIDKTRLGTVNGERPDLMYLLTRTANRHAQFERPWPLHDYPQGGRSYDGKFPGTHYKTGRPMLYTSLVSDALDFQAKGKPVHVALFSISYAFPPEGKQLYDHFLSHETIPDTNVMGEWREADRFYRPFSRQELPIIIYVHRPRLLSDFGSKPEAATRAILTTIGEGRHVLPFTLLAETLATGEPEGDYDTLHRRFQDARQDHEGSRMHPTLQSERIERAFGHALQSHLKLGTLTEENGVYRIAEPGSIQFAANTIQHLR